MQDNQDMIDIGTEELEQIDGGIRTDLCILSLVGLDLLFGTLATLPSQLSLCV